MFFGGKNPLLSKSDPRLSLISIETRRPTFRELRRVHAVLAAVEVCGALHWLNVIVTPRVRQGAYNSGKPGKLREFFTHLPPLGARMRICFTAFFSVRHDSA